MKRMVLKGRKSRGKIARGEALVSKKLLNFLGAVEIKTGTVIEEGHDLEGKGLKDKKLIIPSTKGSTAQIYSLYELKKVNQCPKAILCKDARGGILTSGTALAEIPLMDKIPNLDIIETGDLVTVNPEKGEVIVQKKQYMRSKPLLFFLFLNPCFLNFAKLSNLIPILNCLLL